MSRVFSDSDRDAIVLLNCHVFTTHKNKTNTKKVALSKTQIEAKESMFLGRRKFHTIQHGNYAFLKTFINDIASFIERKVEIRFV